MKNELNVRGGISHAKRIVVKLGTRVLTADDGTLSLVRLTEIAESCARLRLAGTEPIIVSSGAVGLGRDAMGWKDTPVDLVERQLCAAVGQSRLMELYEHVFLSLKVTCAQILLTADDFSSRERYLNLRATLNLMLERGVVPIINENDVVATEELALTNGGDMPAFSDNDRLSALVASKLDADLLCLLTDVDGLHRSDPRTHPETRVLATADDDLLKDIRLTASSNGAGRGGMSSKVDAAMIAARSGCHAVIASGLVPGQLAKILAGQEIGTWFPPRSKLSAKRRWIAFASKPKGTLFIDDGAVAAITKKHCSVLAAGVLSVEGGFARGDIVVLRGPNGDYVGRGIIEVDCDETINWMNGGKPAGVRTLIRSEQLALTESHEG